MKNWLIATEFGGFYSPEPRAEVYCFRLNFNILKLIYICDETTLIIIYDRQSHS